MRTVIKEADVWRVVRKAEEIACLRDKLIVRLLLTRGLRSGEISTLRVEDIDWEEKTIHVLDSKKYCYFEIPVDDETLLMLGEYLEGRREGFVFEHFTKARMYRDKPLSPTAVFYIVQRIAKAAGVRGFNPRWFRRYLAAFWMQKTDAGLAGLQLILRHKNVEITWNYANQFCFAEDVRRQADRVTSALLSSGEVKPQQIQRAL